VSQRVLIVDDDASLRESLELVLASEGYQVHTAAHAREAPETEAWATGPAARTPRHPPGLREAGGDGTVVRSDHSCVHHAGCPDGFGAAWATWRAWGRAGEFVARGHEDTMRGEDVGGALVAFVDIAPGNREILALAQHAAQLIVLDHHVTAGARLLEDDAVRAAMDEGGHVLHFDMSHSGAVLAWQHFHAGEPVPELLRYVEDQDLWNWKLPHSEEVNAAIGSRRREFEEWQALAARSPEELAGEGEPILRAQRAEVRRSLQLVHPVTVAGLRVEAVNALHHRSHIGHELAKRAAYGHAIGLVYRVQGRTVDASIYSIGDVDVAAVANQYGGGGHRNASGFSVGLDAWLRDFC